MRPIDADTVIERLNKVCVTDDYLFMALKQGVDHATAVINEAPTIDAVPVVHCKDCKEWQRHCGFVDSPNGHCSHLEITTNGYDYCSYGERRN